jgi:hypothetical protein
LIARVAVVALAALAGACTTVRKDPGEGADRPDLARELVAMADADQEARRELHESLERDQLGSGKQPAIAARLVEVDRRNAARLREIVDEHGWPDRALAGEFGPQAAWIVAYHADRDLELQERVLALVAPRLKDGDVEPARFADLTDRVRVARGEPQRFGTQYRAEMVDGRLAFGPTTPIEDPARVDERRAAIGLGALAKDVAAMRKAGGIPDDAPELRNASASRPAPSASRPAAP